MKKFLRKKSIIALMISVCMLIFMQVNVLAGGKAEGTSSLYNQTVSYFFGLIRGMESPTGTLGVKTDVAGNENGIDCHLEKNTEYGTVTLLASSAFGNKTSTDTASTGKGKTGVLQMNNGKYEYVANTWQASESSAPVNNRNYNLALINAAPKYVNKYIGTTKYSIPGDGILETDGWGGSSNWVTSSYPVFLRGGSGLFGYEGYNGNANSTIYSARAVVVCAPGI